jgi:hypothetical protein
MLITLFQALIVSLILFAGSAVSYADEQFKVTGPLDWYSVNGIQGQGGSFEALITHAPGTPIQSLISHDVGSYVENVANWHNSILSVEIVIRDNTGNELTRGTVELLGGQDGRASSDIAKSLFVFDNPGQTFLQTYWSLNDFSDNPDRGQKHDSVNLEWYVVSDNLSQQLANIGQYPNPTTDDNDQWDSKRFWGSFYPDTEFSGIIGTVTRDQEITYACSGFDSPIGSDTVTVKKNRVLPLKASIQGENLQYIDDGMVTAHPVIQVTYQSGVNPAVDVTDDALTGAGTEGNQFKFIDNRWRFNLLTKNYTAPGTYTIQMVSGDGSEYVITPSCIGTFVINN